MVMGGDSCSKGRGFEFRHRILDGQYCFYCFATHVTSQVLQHKSVNKQYRGRHMVISVHSLYIEFMRSPFVFSAFVLSAHLLSACTIK